jgi:hypothetical protein
VSSGQFQADVVINGLFLAQNSSDNGERVRSLLCGRGSLAMSDGMANESLSPEHDLTWVNSVKL